MPDIETDPQGAHAATRGLLLLGTRPAANPVQHGHTQLPR